MFFFVKRFIRKANFSDLKDTLTKSALMTAEKIMTPKQIIKSKKLTLFLFVGQNEIHTYISSNQGRALISRLWIKIFSTDDKRQINFPHLLYKSSRQSN